MLERFREWRKERALRPRPGDTTCRRCGGRWVLAESRVGEPAVTIPTTTNSPVPSLPLRVGGRQAYTVWRCEGCGVLHEQEA